MVKIKIHAMYDHFPDRTPQEGERYIDMYCDSHISECPEGSSHAVAMLLEPRSMIGSAYDFVDFHPERFKAIFTHDSKLLRLENAHYLNWGDVWCTTDSEKTKGISIVSSWKDWCPLHKARLELAKYYDIHPFLGVDCFGSFRDGERDKWDDVRLAHEHYKFAIVIENDRDELWYTEKILNCFANKVVPIYVGATKIHEVFNIEGIIYALDWHDIPQIVKGLDIDREYASRQQAIEDNFRRVEPYKIPWKQRFFNQYESLLEDILNDRP